MNDSEEIHSRLCAMDRIINHAIRVVYSDETELYSLLFDLEIQLDSIKSTLIKRWSK